MVAFVEQRSKQFHVCGNTGIRRSCSISTRIWYSIENVLILNISSKPEFYPELVRF